MTREERLARYLDDYGLAFRALLDDHYSRRDTLLRERPSPSRGWTREWQAWKNRLNGEGVRHAAARRRFDCDWERRAEQEYGL